MNPVDCVAVAERILLVAFGHGVSDDDLQPVDIVGVKQQVVGVGVPLQDRAEKVGEQVFLRHQGEKSRVKCTLPDHDREYNGFVVIDDHVMLRGGRNDTQLSGL